MILNISRQKTALTCWRKTFYNYHAMLEGERSMNLVDGSAFHKGVAIGQATQNWEKAYTDAKALFNVDLASAGLLPEEDFMADVHWQCVKTMIKCYQDNWQDTGMTVVQPECTFYFEIPGTEHFDITMHWRDDSTGLEHWGMPPADAIRRRVVRSPHQPGTWSSVPIAKLLAPPNRACPCYRKHAITGRTDGILSWQGFLWLQEHKTTSIKNEQFWGQWDLDIQLTGYIYGVWKTLGIKPNGVVLNAIYKPSEAQLNAWNKSRKNGPPKSTKDYIEYYRSIYLRNDKDLSRFEQEFTDTCDEWESRIISGRFPMAPVGGHCTAYNRKCDFYDLCLNHDQASYLELMGQRNADYVDEARRELLVKIEGVENEKTADRSSTAPQS